MSIVREFLLAPLNREVQRAFVMLAIRRTERRLRYLAKRGWTIPTEESAGFDPIGDLAISLIGPSLGRHGGEPFGLLFNYLRQNGCRRFDRADSELLFSLVETWIVTHCHQELSKLGYGTNPQLANLKRRIKDILKGEEYVQIEQDRYTIQVTLAEAYDPGDRRPLIDPYNLRQIVQSTFLACTTRTAWCRAVFNELLDRSEFSSAILRHELVSAMIAVNIEYVDVRASQSGIGHSVQTDRHYKVAREAVEKTVIAVTEGGLARFVAKGRLTAAESACLAGAIREYLLDLALCSGTDKLPGYFREYMNQSAQDRYLSDYKHIFETTIEEARAVFGQLMRDFYNREGW